MALMNEPITIVSGLPRSGTSMMMKMLEAGGMAVWTDQVRKADIDNPLGYYELERVKQIGADTSWLPEARGRAFKMVSVLLPNLPARFEYRILYMKRDMQEMLQSQAKMLQRLGKGRRAAGDDVLATLFAHQTREIETWLQSQPNFYVRYLQYHRVVDTPGDTAGEIARFLGLALDVRAMADVVSADLYRNRAAGTGRGDARSPAAPPAGPPPSTP